MSKELVWLHGEVKSPPFSEEARIEAGYLIRQLQDGILLSLPNSRPLPTVGSSCHELRIVDKGHTWRIVYMIDFDAIVILEVFSKKTEATPKAVVVSCKSRIKRYYRTVK